MIISLELILLVHKILKIAGKHEQQQKKNKTKEQKAV